MQNKGQGCRIQDGCQKSRDFGRSFHGFGGFEFLVLGSPARVFLHVPVLLVPTSEGSQNTRKDFRHPSQASQALGRYLPRCGSMHVSVQQKDMYLTWEKLFLHTYVCMRVHAYACVDEHFCAIPTTAAMLRNGTSRKAQLLPSALGPDWPQLNPAGHPASKAAVSGYCQG